MQIDDRNYLIESFNGIENLKFGAWEPTRIEDISALAKLNNLEYINFYDNNVSNIATLIENEGLEEGDYIDMRCNYLDISEGSEALRNIKSLEARGIEIEYIPQKK